MSLEKEYIQIDYTQEGIPASVKNFRPAIYRDGEEYYCIPGAPPENYIMAKGNSIEEAMRHWDAAYQEKAGKK